MEPSRADIFEEFRIQKTNIDESQIYALRSLEGLGLNNRFELFCTLCVGFDSNRSRSKKSRIVSFYYPLLYADTNKHELIVVL